MASIHTPIGPLVPLNSGAIRAGVPVAWLRREVAAGRLPALRVGRRFLVNPDALARALLHRAGGHTDIVELDRHSIETPTTDDQITLTYGKETAVAH
jgi:hypothetical protein